MKLNRYAVALAGAGAVVWLAARRWREQQAAMQMADRVALITGGSRGLGLAIAQEFAGYGVRLVLLARDAEELERARQHLLENGAGADRVLTVACDVTEAGDVQESVAGILREVGPIDILVNDAGVIMVGPVEDQSLENYQQAMQVNFFGALHATLAILPQMLSRGRGAIINIASIGGKVAVPHLLPYTASKFALVGWSEGLHAELAAKGIHVLTVNPGVMATGSHVQAEFTGDRAKEYVWFGSSATLPLTAIDAKAAARRIVLGYLRKEAEIFVGVQATIAGRLAAIAPGLTAFALRIANRLLPASPALSPGSSEPLQGKRLGEDLPAWLEGRGEEALRRYNQA